jgi:hypothetical protein
VAPWIRPKSSYTALPAAGRNLKKRAPHQVAPESTPKETRREAQGGP